MNLERLRWGRLYFRPTPLSITESGLYGKSDSLASLGRNGVCGITPDGVSGPGGDAPAVAEWGLQEGQKLGCKEVEIGANAMPGVRLIFDPQFPKLFLPGD